MMLNCLLHRNLDAIFILPFVAVVQEKVNDEFSLNLMFNDLKYLGSKSSAIC